MFTHQVPGDREADTVSRVRYPKFVMPVWAYLIGLAFKAAALAFRWAATTAVKYWWATLPLAPIVYLYLSEGWLWALAAIIGAASLLTLWWWKYPRSFWRYVGWFYLGKWRQYRVYKGKWQATCTTLGLSVNHGGDKYYPSIVKVRRDSEGDRITVEILAGQVPDDWGKHSERLAYTYGAMACTVHPATGRKADERLLLHMRLHDTLAEIVAPLPIPATPDLRKLPVAIEASGAEVLISLITHVLIVGRTGAGKGSALWSLLAALGNGIRTGIVQLHAFDPKGGVELAFGRSMFHRFYYGDPQDMATAFEDLVTVMKTRQDAKRGITRDHTPTIADPAIVVVVDEFAALTAYVGDKKIKDRIAQAMSTLLTQGRAMGIHVIAALQDPRKEILPFRNLFGTRIALALNETSETDLALDDDATLRGAHCHLIPEDTPGVAYMIRKGKGQPVRIRFPYHSDPEIKALAAAHVSAINGTEPVAVQDIPAQRNSDPKWVINR